MFRDLDLRSESLPGGLYARLDVLKEAALGLSKLTVGHRSLLRLGMGSMPLKPAIAEFTTAVYAAGLTYSSGRLREDYAPLIAHLVEEDGKWTQLGHEFRPGTGSH